MKRLFDVLAASVGLVVLSPLLLLIAALIRACDGRPILFRQERVGRGFRAFSILKFRTMERGDESPDSVPMGDASRVTALGEVLRRTKLDELPQLVNVLRGDMSLVGPRPELPIHVESFRDSYRAILKVRPGITDAASILYRDEAAMLEGAADPASVYARSILPHKIKMAREYVARRSFRGDLWLLATTVVCLLYPRRAFDRLFGSVAAFHPALSIAGQTLIVMLAHLAAVGVRFEGGAPAGDARLFVLTLPLLVALRVIALSAFGLHKNLWRYVGTQDVGRIAIAVAASSLAFWSAITLVLHVGQYSRSVVLLDAAFSIVFLVGARFVRRMQHGLVRDYRHGERALLVGSGDTVERTVLRLGRDRDLAIEVVGIVDVDPARAGISIHGVPVVGEPGDLERLLGEIDPDRVLIAGDSVATETRRQVVQVAARFEKPCTSVARFERRMAGEAIAESDFAAGELLMREPIHADLAGLAERFAGRCVMITGAGGGMGRALARLVSELDPASMVLVDRHESSLERIEREIAIAHPALPLLAELSDMTDAERILEIVSTVKPHVILHAAAATRAGLADRHPGEAFRTNLLGVRTVARAALEEGVATFLLVSSDEAGRGRGAVGVSLRGAELALGELAGRGATRFGAVRCAVALDDPRGPLARWKGELERGGPISVPSPDSLFVPVLRNELAHLVLEAVDRVSGGEVLVLDTGRPVRVLDVARAAILSLGLVPGRDVDITVTGLEDGERLVNVPYGEDDRVWRTSHPRLLSLGADSPEPVSSANHDATARGAVPDLIGAEV